MKMIKTVLMAAMLSTACANAVSAVFDIRNLKIASIRAVGPYPDPAYKDTVEVWFTTPLVFPGNALCSDTRRVYISASNYHVVTAAYLAHSKGRTVNIALDDALLLRGGACEVSYFDVLAQ